MTPDPLDDTLTACTPPTTARTTTLQRELDLLVAESEVAAAPTTSRARQMALGALVALGTLGAGVSAHAAGVLPWFAEPAATQTRTLPAGTSCEVLYRAKGIRDPQHPVDDAARAAAVEATDRFLAGLDLSGAGRSEVSARVDDFLTQRGLPAEAVSVSTATDCEQDR